MTMRIEQLVARAVAEAADIDDACLRSLEQIGTALDLDLVVTWERTTDSGEWRCTARRRRGEPAAFAAGSRERLLAEEGGLETAIEFELLSERGLVAIVEGFGAEPFAPDPELAGSLEALGVGLGQLIERRRAVRSGDVVERRYRATLDASLDCVIAMDHDGAVIEFNPAAERTFGISSEEAVGREMAELIVPPELRESHRAGLRRYLETGEPALLDKRIEIEALRADGTRFPVELTITRIDVPGNPVFTGHLRDITERLRAERELRESRARLVTAADEARQRIERDLHDGSQQQLVSVAMTLEAAGVAIESDPEGARRLLAEASAELREAIGELRELARGIHPAVLTEGGLDPALRGLAARSALPARIGAVPATRFPAPVEAAAYFVVAEGMTNAARHAEGAARVEVELREEGGRLVVEVRDDGPGGAQADGGGLRGLADRVAALGGELEVESPAGAGTVLRAEIPCG
ncbi:MAG TPA: PAS domain S-box protein [Solirubrobacterales bacterium]|nr:PAS domain S-box protein [Solirubrobacterales bacterium]